MHTGGGGDVVQAAPPGDYAPLPQDTKSLPQTAASSPDHLETTVSSPPRFDTDAAGFEAAGDTANEDDELFEIVDFTAASSWERFVRAIEASILRWEVDDGRLGVLDPSRIERIADESLPKVHSRKEVIHFGDSSFVLSYQFVYPRMLDGAREVEHIDDVDNDDIDDDGYSRSSEFIPVHAGAVSDQAAASSALHRP
ncbi:hypothetical protein HK405_001856 [Cladochytrium tenue]|nr:hypothetical protein HK405_001856 [Cladochytrium tenue]